MLDRSLLSRIGNTDKSPFTISTVSSLVFGSRSVVVAEMGTEHVDSGISYSTLLVLPGPLDLSFCAGSATYTGCHRATPPQGLSRTKLVLVRFLSWSQSTPYGVHILMRLSSWPPSEFSQVTDPPKDSTQTPQSPF